MSARCAFRIVPGGPRRHLAIDGALDVTPSLRQLRFRMRIAIAFKGKKVEDGQGIAMGVSSSPGIDDVSIAPDARDDSVAHTFAAIGSAERETRTPLGHLPMVRPAAVGTPFDLIQGRTGRAGVDGIADDGSLPPPLTLALKEATKHVYKCVSLLFFVSFTL